MLPLVGINRIKLQLEGNFAQLVMIIKTRFVRIITFGFANGICIYPFVLIRKEVELTHRLLTHEKIHLRQQLETLILPFYVLYFLEFLFRLMQYRNFSKAYRNISFEREAYYFESHIDYLEQRKPYAWLEFIHRAEPKLTNV